MSPKTVPPPDGCDDSREDGAREDGGETVTGADGRAAEGDLLAAVAVAWSARRIATGHAESFIDPAQRADGNGEIATLC